MLLLRDYNNKLKNVFAGAHEMPYETQNANLGEDYYLLPSEIDYCFGQLLYARPCRLCFNFS
jgi:hypothetical protein